MQLAANSATFNCIPDNSNVTIEAGGLLRLSFSSGAGEVINGLFGAGNISNNVGAVASNVLTVGHANGDGDFSGIISAAVTFAKRGTGTQILSGDNTYTGTTTVSGGTLQIGAGGTTGTLGTGAVTVSDGATLAFNRSNDLTVANAISGAGNLKKQGAGILTLSAATYTGATRVEAGSLVLSNAILPGTSRLEILDGGSLKLNDGTAVLTLNNANTSFAGHALGTATDIDGSLVLTGGHTLNVGSTTGFETLKISHDLTLNGTVVNFQVTGLSTLDKIDLGGSLTVTGSNTINIDLLSAPSLVAGDYTLITSTGALTDSILNNLTLQGLDSLEKTRTKLTLDGTSKNVVLNVSVMTRELVWTGSSDNTTWNTSTTNWEDVTISGTPVAFVADDGVLFNDTASAAARNVSIATTVTPFAIMVDTATAYTLDNAAGGKITGESTLTKKGIGTLTLSGSATHDFTGAVSVLGGTLELTGAGPLLANGGSASLIGASANAARNLIIDGGTLKFSGTADTTTDRSFTIGTGGAVLESAVAGKSVIFNGTASIANTATADNKLTLAGAGNGTIGLVLVDSSTGKLSLEKSGAGTWNLTGNSTYTGTTVIDGGKLTIGVGGSLSATSSVTINSGGTLEFANNTGEATSGANGLGATNKTVTVNSGGTLLISGNNGMGYTGPTNYANVILNDGTFSLSAVQYIRSLTLNGGQVTGTGAVQWYYNDAPVAITSTADATIAAPIQFHASTIQTVEVQDSAVLTVSGVISNTGGLTKTGMGTLLLNATNTYSGATTVSAGTIKLGVANALSGTSGITVASGAMLDLNGATVAKPVTIAGTGVSGAGAIFDSAGNGSISEVILSAAATMGTGGNTALTSITGTGDLALKGNSAGYTLSGAGATVINNGQLILQTKLSSAAAANTINPTAGILIDGGELASSTSELINTGNRVVLANNGTLTFAGTGLTQTLSELSGTSGTVGTSSGSTATLTINAAADSAYSGVIQGDLSLVKAGAGTWTLGNAANAYTGGTTISGGTLKLTTALATSGNDVLGAQTSGVVLDGGSLLSAYSGLSATGRTLTLGTAGGSLVSSGTGVLQFLSTGSLLFTSGTTDTTLTLGGDSTADNQFALNIVNSAAGSTSLTKTGTGKWIISGTNTYTGNTSVINGILALGAENAISTASALVLGDGTTAGSIDLNGYNQTLSRVTVNGTGNRIINTGTSSILTLNFSADQSLDVALGAAGGNDYALAKTGNGKLTLAGTATYTGDTTVKAGTLALVNSTFASNNITIYSGASLDVSGLAGGLTIASGRSIVSGSTGTTSDLIGSYILSGGSLSAGKTGSSDIGYILKIDGALDITGASTLGYIFSSSVGGTNSTIKTGGLNLGAQTTIDAYLSEGLLSTGSYTLFEYTSLSGNVGNLLYGNYLDPRYNLTFRDDAANKRILMNVESTSSDNPLTWVGDLDGGRVGEWSALASNFVQEGAGNVTYFPGDFAIFDNTANAFDITVGSGGVILGRATFNNDTTHDYTISGGEIRGDGYIEKRGTGKLTLNNANSYAGVINEDGTRSAGTILVSGTIAVGNDLALGAGSMYVYGGTLQSVGTHTLANDVAIAHEGIFTLDSSTGDLTLAGAISGDYKTVISKIGTGTVGLTGDGSGFSGLVQHTQGTLSLGGIDHSQAKYNLTGVGTTLEMGALGDQTVKIGQLTGEAGTILQTSTTGTKTFEVGALNTSSLFAGTIQDNADIVALTKVGTGTLVLTGQNTNTGETHVQAGMLQIGNDTDSTLGTGDIFISSGATLAFYTTGNNSLDQLITGTGALQKEGTNTLTITRTNLNFSGTVQLNSGELVLAGTGTLGTAQIVNNATLVLDRTGDYTLENTISGIGTITKQDAGTLTYLGNNTATGATTVTNGTLALGNNTLVQNQTYTPTVSLATGTTLQLAPADGGTATLTSVAGTGTLDHIGDGTSILTGNLQANQVNINTGILQLGSGSEKAALAISAPVALATDGTLLVTRTGDTRLSGQLSGDGNLTLQGDIYGSGTLVLANATNDLTGTITVQKRSILQIGDTSTEGSINTSGNDVTVDIGQRATLRYTNAGSETGDNLTLTGSGTFDYNGGSTLRFTSDATAFTGTIQASQGTLQLDADQLPANTLNAVDTGVLQIKAATDTTLTNSFGTGNGTITLTSASAATPVTYQIDTTSTFGGNLVVASATTLQLNTRTVGAKLLTLQSSAYLRGNGTIKGDLHNQLGGTIHPGNSVGQINIQGNLINDGTVLLDVDSASSFSTIHYTGTAQLNTSGTLQLILTQDTYDNLALGTELKILVDDNTTDGASSVIGNFDLSKVTLLVDGNTLNGKAITYNKGDGGLTLLLASSIRDIPGLSLHDGLDGYIGYLDNILHNPTDYPEQVSTISGFLGSADLSATLNNASPIGLASLTAMTTAIAHDDAETLRSHLESLRYQRGATGQAIDTMPYIVGTGLFVSNGSGSSNPAFDFNTYGGLIGVDQSFGPDLIMGMNVGYHSGKADLHNGAGKVTLNNASLSVYGSYMFSNWLYLDAGVYGGYNSYEIKHDTLYGRATAKPEGFNYGANIYLGTIVPLSQQFSLTPYAGIEYVRTDVDAFTEKGTQSALHLDAFTQDSLRAKIGTGINWQVPTGADFTLRVGLNAAFAHELLDDEVDMEARFANDYSGNKYKVSAVASPENLVQVGPMIEFGFDENKSLTLGYTLEYDFEDQTAHHLNATFRMRF
ncbi:MAG: autotransporter-associated beta strand repeat-containing protein [Puniceicoccales bacterium]|nr:autotransporter-associated beta strand repeat-containing protein [Puniceicoccales bacterium]